MEQGKEASAGESLARRMKRLPEQWRALIEAQAVSGLGVEAFCSQQQLTPSCFYRWRRFLSQGAGAASPWVGEKRQRRPASSIRPSSSRSVGPVPAIEGFAAVRVAAQTSGPRSLAGESIRLLLAGGRELILPVSMPVDRLVELLIALELSGRERGV